MIDKSRHAFRRSCPRTSRGQQVVGFGFDRDHLAEAGIERAGALAAVTSGDNSNILTARIARENFGIERVVAADQGPAPGRDLPAARHPHRRHGLVDHRPGDAPAAPDATSSRTSGSTRAARSASSTTRSPPGWAGKKLAPLSEPGLFWLVAVTRLGAAQVSTPSAIGQEGDILHFAADVSALDDAPRAAPARAGATDARSRSRAPATSGSSSPTTSWRTGTRCCSSSRTPEVAERAEASDGVEWHVADACEVSELRDAGLETCDVVVAATGDDEDNLVVSLLAKQEFAVPRVIARVNHPKNEWLFNENWGVDLSVSTPHLITALVEEAVTVGRLVRILQFEGGQARLVEVTLADDSPAIDQALTRPRRAPRRDDRRGRARRARGDAAGRHDLRGRRRGARDGDAGLRGRGPPHPHRRLTRPGRWLSSGSRTRGW